MKASMKKKDGGKINEYNAQGSPESKEDKDTTPEFKSGGKAKGKKAAHGGHAKGKAPKARLDRKPRASGGRTPYTTAKSISGGASEDEEGKRNVTGPGAETELSIYKSGGRAKHKKG